MNEELHTFTNVYSDTCGHIKYLGWKSFEEFIRVITKANKHALKTGFKTEVRFTLPIKMKAAKPKSKRGHKCS